MALTDNSHVAARINESAFNNIITTFISQRPATFNYATKTIIQSGQSCSPINVHPALESKEGFEKWTELKPIALPLTDDEYIDYCVQLSELKIDFEPANSIDLPPELGELEEQEISLLGKACAGVACGQMFRKIDLPDIEREIDRFKGADFNGIIKFPGITRLKIHCFCLELIAKLKVKRDNTHLSLDISGIELRDIKPDGLENSIECIIMKIIEHGVLPQLKIELSALSFGVQDYFSIAPTPTSQAVPFNPSIKDNNLNIFLNINEPNNA